METPAAIVTPEAMAQVMVTAIIPAMTMVMAVAVAMMTTLAAVAIAMTRTTAAVNFHPNLSTPYSA